VLVFSLEEIENIGHESIDNLSRPLLNEIFYFI